MARAAFWAACGILIGYQGVLLVGFSRIAGGAFLDEPHSFTSAFLRLLPLWWAVPVFCTAIATHALARRGFARGMLAMGACLLGTLALMGGVYGPLIWQEWAW